MLKILEEPKTGKKLSETRSTPEGKKRMSETIKNAWKTDSYRKKYSESKKIMGYYRIQRKK